MWTGGSFLNSENDSCYKTSFLGALSDSLSVLSTFFINVGKTTGEQATPKSSDNSNPA